MKVNESTSLSARVEPAQPVALSDMERMGRAIAASQLFGIKTPEQAVALMLVAQAEGRHPASAAQDYNIIQGRPSLKADAILARFQQAGGVIEWEEITDARAAARFSHPQSCPKPVLIDWTMERAKTAGLAGKDNWRKWPRQMLRARVVSEGARTAYPASCSGMYSVEEAEDMEPAYTPPAPKEPPKERDPLMAAVTGKAEPPMVDAEIIPPEPAPASAVFPLVGEPVLSNLKGAFRAQNFTRGAVAKILLQYGVKTLDELTLDQAEELLAKYTPPDPPPSEDNMPDEPETPESILAEVEGMIPDTALTIRKFDAACVKAGITGKSADWRTATPGQIKALCVECRAIVGAGI